MNLRNNAPEIQIMLQMPKPPAVYSCCFCSPYQAQTWSAMWFLEMCCHLSSWKWEQNVKANNTLLHIATHFVKKNPLFVPGNLSKEPIFGVVTNTNCVDQVFVRVEFCISLP